MDLVIHHLTLTVSNADTSANWYQELLGKASVISRQLEGAKRIRMQWDSGLVIGVTEFDSKAGSQVFSHLNVGLDHIGLQCASLEEIQIWSEKLKRLGFEHGPIEDAPYGWAITARDPDNIPVEFYCPK